MSYPALLSDFGSVASMGKISAHSGLDNWEYAFVDQNSGYLEIFPSGDLSPNPFSKTILPLMER